MSRATGSAGVPPAEPGIPRTVVSCCAAAGTVAGTVALPVRIPQNLEISVMSFLVFSARFCGMVVPGKGAVPATGA